MPPRIAAFLLLAVSLAMPSASAATQTVDIEVGTRPDGSMYLEPVDSTVALGTDVTMAVKNVDRIFHDVALLDYDGNDVEIEVPAGKTEIYRFKATVAGDFRLICEVSGHKQKGMFGFLHVVDPDAKKGLPGFEMVGLLTALALVGLAMRKVK